MTTKPNIVYILTDQHRFDALGRRGNPVIRTPNLDRLAGEGVLFANTWCQSPICQPSRAAILTGRYPHELGIVQNFQADFDPEWETMPKALQRAGYVTASVGKTHYLATREATGTQRDTESDAPRIAAFGFDHVVEEFDLHVHAKPGIVTPYLRYLRRHGLLEPYLDAVRSVLPFTENHWKSIVGPMPAGFGQSDFLTNEALNWLRCTGTDAPFYLQLAYIQPHSPLIAGAAWAEHYADVDVPLGPGDEPVPTAEVWQQHISLLQRRSQSHKLTNEYLRKTIRTYYAMVSEIDACVGRITEHLTAAGQLDNTWIIFGADHGDMTGDHRMMAKQTFYRSSVQIPAIVRPPEPTTESGSVKQGLTESIDLTATIIDIAGADPIPHSSGRSLVPRVTQPMDAGRPFAFSEIGADGNATGLFWAVRDDDHRLTVDITTDTVCEAFDLSADPDETTNLAGTQVGERITDRLKPYLDSVPQNPGWGSGHRQ